MSNYEFTDDGFVDDGYIFTGRPVIFQSGANRVELRGPSKRSGRVRLLQAEEYSSGWARYGYAPLAIVHTLTLEYQQLRSDEVDQLKAFQIAVDYSAGTFDYIDGANGLTVPAWFAEPDQAIEEISYNKNGTTIELHSLSPFVALPAAPANIDAILNAAHYPCTVRITRKQPQVWMSDGTRRVSNKSAITRQLHTLALVRLTADQLAALIAHFIGMGGMKDRWTWQDVRPVLAEGTTNLLSANQADVELNTSGFAAAGGWFLNPGAAISRDNSVSYVGEASLKTVTNGTSIRQGMVTTAIGAAANTPHTLSAWVLAPAGATMWAFLRDGTNGIYSLVIFSGTGTWQKISATITTGAIAVTDLRMSIQNALATAITYWVDALQIEAKDHATPFVVGSRPDYPEPVAHAVRFAEPIINWQQSPLRSDRYDLTVSLEEDL